jgi:hypothetical protein
MKLANRELGTVEGIGQDGRMSLKRWTEAAQKTV